MARALNPNAEPPFGSTLDDLAWVAPSAPLAPLAPGATAVLKWDEASTATWYRGPHFGIGSASDNYYNMDKTPFVAALGPGPSGDAPVVAFWMDARKDYYGLSRILEGSGHWKSLHLRPFEAAAQGRNAVLFLAADDGEGQGRLESTVTLPADAEYWLNGTKVDLFHQRSQWDQVPPPGEATAITVVPTAPAGAVAVRAWLYSTTAAVGSFHLTRVEVADVETVVDLVGPRVRISAGGTGPPRPRRRPGPPDQDRRAPVVARVRGDDVDQAVARASTSRYLALAFSCGGWNRG